MAEYLDPEVMLAVVRSRCTIRSTRRKLEKARHQRRPLSRAEIETALEQKAFFLGRELKTDVNPFEGWDLENADRLAQSFRLGTS